MHTNQVSYFTLGTQITLPFISPFKVASACISLYSIPKLERTSKHANYVNRSIIFQPNFEPMYPLTARAEPFDFYIFCRAIHGLSVHIYIARVRVVKKKCTKICGNISRVSSRDEVAKNGHNAGRHSQTGIQSGFVNSREVPLRTLTQVRFVSAIASWS